MDTKPRSKYHVVDLKKSDKDAKAAPSWSQIMVGAMPKAAEHYTVPVGKSETTRVYAGPTPRIPIKAIVQEPVAEELVVVPSRTAPGRPPADAGRPLASPGLLPRRAKPRRRLLRLVHRGWARLVAPLDVAWLGDLEVMVWILVVLGAVGVATPLLMKIVPQRVRASKTTAQMTQGYKELFDAEEKVLRQTGNYIDPAQYMRDEGIALLLDPQYEVLTSTADDNHWYLKLRSRSAGTVCTALSMTYLTRSGGGFKMECRRSDPLDATASVQPRPATPATGKAHEVNLDSARLTP